MIVGEDFKSKYSMTDLELILKRLAENDGEDWPTVRDSYIKTTLRIESSEPGWIDGLLDDEFIKINKETIKSLLKVGV